MRKFVSIVLIALILFTGVAFYTFFQADGYADSYYLKMTKPKQTSMVLGTSKAAQGIQPSELKRAIGKDIFNYAFNIRTSPYGPVYFESIRKKLDSSTTNGVFILTVDPWSLSVYSENALSIAEFREQRTFMAELKDVSSNPNLEYLINHFDGSYYKIFKRNGVAKVEDDGWLHVNLKNDIASVNRRSRHTLNNYKEYLDDLEISAIRIEWLERTMDYLDDFGSVYLVRLPVHPELQKIEDELMPDFKLRLQFLIDKASGYVDLTERSDEFQYTDAVHLTPESGKLVSRLIGEWIVEISEDNSVK